MKPLLDQLRKKSKFNDRAVEHFVWVKGILHLKSALEGARFQHKRDKAIILKLIEIIEEQSEALEFLKTRTDENSDGFSNWASAVGVLASTESKLKSLLGEDSVESE